MSYSVTDRRSSFFALFVSVLLLASLLMAIPPAEAANSTVRDEFSAVSYSNDDGTTSWSGPWVELGDSAGADGGDIAVVDDLGGGRLRVGYKNRSVERSADLTGATSATLSFSYRRDGLDNSADFAAVEMSSDGMSWTEVARYEGPGTDASYLPVSFDASSFVSTSTSVRFVTSAGTGKKDMVFFDDVQIEFDVQALSDLGATPAALDFGVVEMGNAPSLNLDVTHLGTSGDPDIQIDAATISGADAGEFSHDLVPPVVLGPGAGSSVSMTFAPVSVGSNSATLEVSHNGANSPLLVALSAEAAEPGVESVLDRFDAVSYSNNDGSVLWAGDWVELGDSSGASGGDVEVVDDGGDGSLQLSNSDRSMARSADLSAATLWATLSLDVRRNGLDNVDDYVALEVSSDGVSWVELDRFVGPATDGSYGAFSYDVVAFASSSITVRLVTSSSLAKQDKVYVDNVQIEYSTVLQNLLVDPVSLSLQIPVDQQRGAPVAVSTDSGVADFSVSSDAGSLSADPDSGSTPTSVTLNGNAAGLGVGSYLGTATLSAPGFADTTVTVAMEVTPAEPLPGTVTVQLEPALVTTVAGDGNAAVVDGPGVQASFAAPGAVTVAGGLAIVADGHGLRSFDPVTGDVATWLGDPAVAGCVDSAVAAEVRFTDIVFAATDPTYLYVIDSCSVSGGVYGAVRRVDIASGATVTLPAAAADIPHPRGMVYAPDGFLYVTTETGNAVYQVHPVTGAASVVHSGGRYPEGIAADETHLYVLNQQVFGSFYRNSMVKISLADFTAVNFGGELDVDRGVLVSAGDYLYGADADGTYLKRWTKADESDIVVAGAGAGGFVDGVENEAWFGRIDALATDGTQLWVVDGANYRLRTAAPIVSLPRGQVSSVAESLDFAGTMVVTIAGNGTAGTVDGMGSEASFENLRDVVVVDGFAYVAQQTVIRKVDLATGEVSTFAGQPGVVGENDAIDPAQVTFNINKMITDGYWLYTDNGDGGSLDILNRIRRTSTVTGATSAVGTLNDTSDLPSVTGTTRCFESTRPHGRSGTAPSKVPAAAPTTSVAGS